MKQLLIKGKHTESDSQLLYEKKALCGKTICFTDVLNSNHQGKPITREIAQRISIEHRLIVESHMTRIVTSVPETMSIKAREYNIQVNAITGYEVDAFDE